MSGAGSERPLRILYLSPLFAPVANPEAFCGSKMAMSLMEQGVDVTVIYDDGFLEREIRARDSSRLWDSLAGVAIPARAPADRRTFGTFYNTARYRFYRRDFPRWVDVAVGLARELHHRKPFDLVYSRCLPVRACVAGYWAAQALDLPWVVNINDPWAQYLRPRTLAGKRSPVRVMVYQYWLEKTLRTADLMTYPCPRLAAYTERCAGVGQEWTVIPHIGFSVPAEARDDEFTLVHAGLLGQDTLRSAEGLLKGLSQFLEKRPEARSVTQLSLIGPEDPNTQALVAAFDLHSVVTASGRVDYEESLRHIASAAVCIVVEVKLDEGIFLPSKLADYFAARKPVLALSPSKGTIADMAPDPGLVRVDPDDSGAIARAIEELYEDHHRGRLHVVRKPSEELVRSIEASTVAAQFLEALDKTGIIQCARRPHPIGFVSTRKPEGRYKLSSPTPKVSVVMVTYGREEVLCLAIRLVLADPYENKEVLVIDQTPTHTPETQNYLESVKDSIRYIRMDHPNLVEAENLGIRSASGEIVLFLDDDVIFEPGLIEAHVRNYVDGTISAVTGLVLHEGQSPLKRFPQVCRIARFGYLFFRHDYNRRVVVPNVSEGNASFRRQVLLDVGAADENFHGAAYLWGMDLSVRVAKTGGKIVHDPEARLIHLRYPTGGVRMRTAGPLSYFRNLFYFLYKHAGKHERFSIALRVFFFRVLAEGWRHPWVVPLSTKAFVQAWLGERKRRRST